MEVNSKAGFYTSKSPQMILHEWCRRQNRPKPRYKTLPTEDGRFRCRVHDRTPRAGASVRPSLR